MIRDDFAFGIEQIEKELFQGWLVGPCGTSRKTTVTNGRGAGIVQIDKKVIE